MTNVKIVAYIMLDYTSLAFLKKLGDRFLGFSGLVAKIGIVGLKIKSQGVEKLQMLRTRQMFVLFWTKNAMSGPTKMLGRSEKRRKQKC